MSLLFTTRTPSSTPGEGGGECAGLALRDMRPLRRLQLLVCSCPGLSGRHIRGRNGGGEECTRAGVGVCADEGGIASRSWGEEAGTEGGREGVCRDGDAARLSKDATCRGRVSLVAITGS